MAKQHRLRSKLILMPVAGWLEADQMLKRIGELQAGLDIETGKATAAINQVKTALAARKQEVDEKITLYAASLQAFAENNRADFGDAKSRKLDFGSVGWRKSTKIAISKRTLELIGKMLPPRLRSLCTIVKEDVSKDGLAELTEEQLASVEARRDIKDVFFAEPFVQEAADKGQK